MKTVLNIVVEKNTRTNNYLEVRGVSSVEKNNCLFPRIQVDSIGRQHGHIPCIEFSTC